MDEPDVEVHYRTENMAQAAALYTEGYACVVERVTEGKRRVVWIFSGDDKMKGIAHAYNEGELLVDPRAYINSYTKVRSMMYDLLGIEKRKSAAA